MRNEFIKVFTEIAREDKDVTLITGDLGFGVLTDFAEKFSKQFLNAGVAEQNMTGLAMGMAMEGKIVYTYSIGNFPTLRCLEQIRNDACYHDANLKIVTVGGGFSYGSLGMTHHATEDLAIMRALPNMTVVAPGDPKEAGEATRAIYEHPGPCYLRLGRAGEPQVHEGSINFQLGKAIEISQGNDVALIATGGLLKNALDAMKELSRKGIDTGLYSMHTIKPIDKDLIKSLSETNKLIVTVEEHNLIGGLGGAVAEVLAQIPQPKARLKMIGLDGTFSTKVGDQEYLRKTYGMSVGSIVDMVIEKI